MPSATRPRRVTGRSAAGDRRRGRPGRRHRLIAAPAGPSWPRASGPAYSPRRGSPSPFPRLTGHGRRVRPPGPPRRRRRRSPGPGGHLADGLPRAAAAGGARRVGRRTRPPRAGARRSPRPHPRARRPRGAGATTVVGFAAYGPAELAAGRSSPTPPVRRRRSPRCWWSRAGGGAGTAAGCSPPSPTWRAATGAGPAATWLPEADEVSARLLRVGRLGARRLGADAGRRRRAAARAPLARAARRRRAGGRRA